MTSRASTQFADKDPSSQPSTPVVDMRSVGHVYANGTRALQPMDLTIREGEFITLLGPSGCGKSTLLKMVAGMVSPSEGRLTLWDDPAANAGGNAGKKMAFVFQEATLMPWCDILSNVRLPLDLKRVARKEANARVFSALEQVGQRVVVRWQGARPGGPHHDLPAGPGGLQAHLARRVGFDQRIVEVPWRQQTPVGDLEAGQLGFHVSDHAPALRAAQLADVVEGVLGVVDQHLELAAPHQRVAFQQRQVSVGGHAIRRRPGGGLKSRAQVVHPCEGSPSKRQRSRPTKGPRRPTHRVTTRLAQQAIASAAPPSEFPSAPSVATGGGDG